MIPRCNPEWYVNGLWHRDSLVVDSVARCATTGRYRTCNYLEVDALTLHFRSFTFDSIRKWPQRTKGGRSCSARIICRNRKSCSRLNKCTCTVNANSVYWAQAPRGGSRNSFASISCPDRSASHDEPFSLCSDQTLTFERNRCGLGLHKTSRVVKELTFISTRLKSVRSIAWRLNVFTSTMTVGWRNDRRGAITKWWLVLCAPHVQISICHPNHDFENTVVRATRPAFAEASPEASIRAKVPFWPVIVALEKLNLVGTLQPNHATPTEAWVPYE